MKRALVIASTASMIDQFNMPNIRLLLDLGYEVDVACNFKRGNSCSDEKVASLKNALKEWNVPVYQIDFERNVTKLSENWRAYKQVKKIIKVRDYDLAHCHTPIGSVVTRLACRKARKRGMKVIYTAHGFHFYKGAPLKNWLLYYPVEKLCSRWTDVLITINQEDYALAQRKMKAKKIVYVPGVGVDLTKFGVATVDRAAKRRELGIPEDAVFLLSVGELIKRKNHKTVIRALAQLANRVNVYYAIAGRGGLAESLQALAVELNVAERVKLLGFRTDVADLLKATDALIFPSFQEGLPVSVMEAMAGGLPCILSRIRGNVDLVDEKGGAHFDPHSVDDCRAALASLLEGGVDKMREMGAYNAEKVKAFGLEPVLEQMNVLYRSVGDAT